MKSKRQVINYLRNKQVRDYDTLERISKFIRNNKARVVLGTLAKSCLGFSSSDDSVTFESFSFWFKSGLGNGDIVSVSSMPDSFLMVGDVRNNESKIEVQAMVFVKGSDIEVNPKEPVWVNCSECSLVSDEVRLQFMNRLISAGYFYDEETGICAKGFLPTLITPVSFRKGLGLYVGILERIDTDRDIAIFSCWADENDNVHYGMGEDCEFSLSDIVMVSASYAVFSNFKHLLAKNGLHWNGKCYRLEGERKMLNTGEQYWYISSYFQIVSSTQGKGSNRSGSRLRFMAGNYFYSMEEAMDCLVEIQEVLKRKLAKPRR